MGSSTDLFLLVRLRELGFDRDWHLPLIWCGFHLLKSYGNLLIGRWTDRVSPRRLLAAGWIVYALIYLGMGWVESPLPGLGLFLLYAAYYALTEPPEKALVVQLAERRASVWLVPLRDRRDDLAGERPVRVALRNIRSPGGVYERGGWL